MNIIDFITDAKDRAEVKALLGFFMLVLAGLFAVGGGLYILIASKSDMLPVVLGIAGFLATTGTALLVTQAVADSKIDSGK